MNPFKITLGNDNDATDRRFDYSSDLVGCLIVVKSNLLLKLELPEMLLVGPPDVE